jgi:malate dehydrogenase (oxaloacetate-decarboxylating)
MRDTSINRDGDWETTQRGRQVFSDPRINKGTAFPEEERRALGLVGLMPPRVLTLQDQAIRAYAQYQVQPTPLAKHVYLTALHDRNEVLFYALVSGHLPEMLPVIYTPTVGEAIERYSHEYRRPRGVYLSVASVDSPDQIEECLAATGLDAGDVDLLVATDAEAILGIGDWGVGGIGIAVGKLIVYTAAGGINPHRTIAAMLDVGTNRQSLLDDPMYLGNRHPRVPTDVYDRFIDDYVTAATKMFPDALLHWEDFGAGNARRILERYRDRVLTFNDDMQGTGAINLAAVLAGVRASGIRLREHRVVVFGAGTAGIGIADQLRDAMAADRLSTAEATARFWCLDRHGLLTDDMADLRDYQEPYARPAAEVRPWARDPQLGENGGYGLAEVVRRVQPTILIGTSTVGGAFTEDVVCEMAAHAARPIILPMSNPTVRAEAVPADVLSWSDGRALVATGSPFAPVSYGSITYSIGQANNALIFPGLGLGVIVARATRITDGMLLAAARAVAGRVDPTLRGASLLPGVEDVWNTSVAVAVAVVGAAQRDRVARTDIQGDVEEQVRAAMWIPTYRRVLAV